MTMQVGPNRRVRINVLPPLRILKHRPFTRLNDDRLLSLQPILHLRERMPEVTMIFLSAGDVTKLL